MSTTDIPDTNELFVEAIAVKGELTFDQIMERLDSVNYWQEAGLADASRTAHQKHVRGNLRSLHIDGLPVFAAFQHGRYAPQEWQHHVHAHAEQISLRYGKTL